MRVCPGFAGFSDGSYLPAQDQIPARAGAGGLLKVEVMSREKTYVRQISEFSLPLPPTVQTSFAAEVQALAALLGFTHLVWSGVTN